MMAQTFTRCIYSNKDKNFKANHNMWMTLKKLRHVVSIVTKIRILKQITTTQVKIIVFIRLYL